MLSVACSGSPAVEPRATAPSPTTAVSATAERVSVESAAATPATDRRPRFVGGVRPITRSLREVLIGRNWRPGCPVALRDLRLVEVSYWNFHGAVRRGPLVVHERVARDVLWVFRRLYPGPVPDPSDRSATAVPATSAERLVEHAQPVVVVQLSPGDG